MSYALPSTDRPLLHGLNWAALACFCLCLALLLTGQQALAHGMESADAEFVRNSQGVEVLAFAYLGAKHMVTGYDHLLFLFGVIFFLHRIRDVATYVSLFSLGHSITLITGVALDIGVDSHIVDALIGLSVVWKGFDNLGGAKSFGWRGPDNRWMVFGFGLIHGFGLATKVQDLNMPRDGLIPNLLSFNVGVELGQVIALIGLLAVMALLRGAPHFSAFSKSVNIGLMIAGFLLTGYQIAGYFYQEGSV